MYREALAPEYLVEKKLLIKAKAEKQRNESGQYLPLSEKQLNDDFDRELNASLEAFHSALFAIDLVPENSERFGFESITSAARAEASKALSLQSRKPRPATLCGRGNWTAAYLDLKSTAEGEDFFNILPKKAYPATMTGTVEFSAKFIGCLQIAV
jgi:hypothetical protein